MIIEFTPPSKPSIVFKMLILLRDFPEIRNSYDLIAEKWNHVYGNKLGRITIERVARTIQYDLNMFPPSEETKQARRCSQKRIIQGKQSVFHKLLSWFKF